MGPKCAVPQTAPIDTAKSIGTKIQNMGRVLLTAVD